MIFATRDWGTIIRLSAARSRIPVPISESEINHLAARCLEDDEMQAIDLISACFTLKTDALHAGGEWR